MKTQKTLLDFGAVGDGSHDDTNAILNAIQVGGAIYVPPGDWILNSPIKITRPTMLYGAGSSSVIHVATQSLGYAIEILSGSTIIRDLSLIGPTSSGYLVNDSGIFVKGDDTENRVQNVTVENCRISNFGFHAIETRFASQCSVSCNSINTIGYAGIQCLSSDCISVCNNVIRDIRIDGQRGDECYGIAFSPFGETASDAHPACRNCCANSNVVDRVLNWEGMDCHNGIDITFANNQVRNCKKGIAVVAKNSDSSTTMRNIVVIGNSVDAGIVDAPDYGIVARGALTNPATDVQISGNVVVGYGDSTEKNSGAIHAKHTARLSINNNIVHVNGEDAILFEALNSNFICSGNLVTSDSTPFAVRSSGEASGLVTGNRVSGFTIQVSKSVTNTNNH